LNQSDGIAPFYKHVSVRDATLPRGRYTFVERQGLKARDRLEQLGRVLLGGLVGASIAFVAFLLLVAMRPHKAMAGLGAITWPPIGFVVGAIVAGRRTP
jgi:hypothetical protein